MSKKICLSRHSRREHAFATQNRAGRAAISTLQAYNCNLSVPVTSARLSAAAHGNVEALEKVEAPKGATCY